MKRVLFAALAVSASLSSAPARAERGFLEKIESLLAEVPGLGMIFSQARECPEMPEKIEGRTVPELFSEGERLMQNRRTACEAARYFFQIRRENPYNGEVSRSRIKYVEALLAAGDYVEAINEANLYLEENPKGTYAEYAHYLIIRAVFEQIPDAQHTQEWTGYALGINKNQHELKPFIENLNFQVYLDRYPDSPRRADVEAKLKIARDRLAEHFYSIGMFYLERRQYKAAIGRFGFVTEHGLHTTSFEPSLYQMSVSYRRLAEDILSGKMSDQQLAILVDAPQASLAPELRRDIAQKAMASALQVEGEMRRNRPESLWTKKLSETPKR